MQAVKVCTMYWEFDGWGGGGKMRGLGEKRGDVRCKSLCHALG